MPKPARSRVKACERCHAVSDTLYRIVADGSGAWTLVCPACRASFETSEHYRYSGTWKADKRH